MAKIAKESVECQDQDDLPSPLLINNTYRPTDWFQLLLAPITHNVWTCNTCVGLAHLKK